MLSWLAKPFRALATRIAKDYRTRRNRRMRKLADYCVNQERDIAERQRESAQQQLNEAQARLRVLEAELAELYAVLVRNHTRVQRETAVECAQQALAENGMALLKTAAPRQPTTA